MMSKTLLLGVFAGAAVVAAANDDGGRIWVDDSGASGAALPSSTVNLRITDLQTPVMEGWTDVKTSKFLGLPAYLEGIRADVLTRLIGKGSTLNWECTSGGSGSPARACIAYLFMYSCHPCKAANGDGLPADLVADDWERVPCQGQFSLAADPSTGVARRHDFHIFRKMVNVGQQVSVGPLRDDLAYAFLGLDKEGRMCSKQDTPAACGEADFAAHCEWNPAANAGAGACEPTKCPRRVTKPGGPHQPRCSYCVAQDEPFLKQP